MKKLFLYLSFFCLFVVSNTALAQTAETGKFTLYKYQRAMGAETYQIKSAGGTIVLDANFGLTFVGSPVSVTTILEVDKKTYEPKRYITKGSTSTRTEVDAKIAITDGKAKVDYDSHGSTRKIPERFFTILHPAPVSPQMLLFRYWKKHRMSGEIPLLPGGAAKIELLGKDRIRIKDKVQTLERYSIEGVMWGRETVWFDQDENLIALVGADAEMDRFEAVREGYEDHLMFFVRRAAEDAVGHLQELSRRIRPVYRGKYAISGGLLVGGKDFQTIPDSVILIENGKIRDVGKRGEVKIPKSFKVFDARGKTILPGLFDTHAHATQAEWFPASLAAGITTLRDAANEPEFIVPIRDAEKSGQITVSPRILLAGFIDSGETAVGNRRADDEAQAREIVREYRRAGFEQIKIYQSLKPELVRIVTDEAHRLGMTVTGHIPRGLNIYTAVDNGYDQINHLGFIMRVMSPRDLPDGEKQNFDPENETAKAGFRFLIENGIVVEPTLARAEMSSKVLGDSYAATEPGAARVPFEFAALVKGMGNTPEAAERRRAGRDFSLKVLKALHEAGVPLIVGTDLVVPGHTEHREIELFVKAGISPLDAIKAATIVPARAMKVDDRLGTIEPGKLADLVILEANPLEAIGNIRRVKFVVKDGKMFDPAPLWRSVGFAP